MRWNLKTSPSRMIVWPALLPPWKRTMASAFSASRSTTLPLPSSPHWAPTTQIPDISRPVYSACDSGRSNIVMSGVVLLSRVGSPERQDLAHLLQPRHRALVDLLGEVLAFEVRRDDHGALVLVARVDDRVELLEHPGARLLGSDVRSGEDT